MDEIIFFCSRCNTKLTAGVEDAGEEFDCPKCQTIQLVPSLEATEEEPKRITTRLKAAEAPPPPPTGVAPGAPVVQIPKRKIVVPKSPEASGEEYEEYLEELGGSGMRLFAVALGTVGFVLCFLALIWAVMSLQDQHANGWMMLMMFTSTFLSGLMGLVLAQLARFMVRVAERLDQLEYD